MDDQKNVNTSTENQETDKDVLSQEPFADTAGKARRLLSKRWVYPAIYLGAAALIIGLMYLKSQMGSAPVSTGSVDEGTATGTSAQTAQEWVWPAASGVQTTVAMGFFPDQGNPNQQAAALVFYDNAYYPHQGIDIKATNGEAFDVVAAVAGKVTAVDNNPLYGNTIEVQAANGYTVRYESLSQTNVKVGDTVQPGQVIGRTGTCEFEAGQGNHLFFQVLKDGKPVDPQTLVSPPATTSASESATSTAAQTSPNPR